MEEKATPAVPYFWSDQYGKKIQMLGHPRPDDEVVMVSGRADEMKWLSLYVRDNVVTGILALSNPRGLATAKMLLDRLTSIDDARALAPWAELRKKRRQRVPGMVPAARSTVCEP